jgi:hypothetical protein
MRSLSLPLNVPGLVGSGQLGTVGSCPVRCRPVSFGLGSAVFWNISAIKKLVAELP